VRHSNANAQQPAEGIERHAAGPYKQMLDEAARRPAKESEKDLER
jgi:hypothetical protein